MMVGLNVIKRYMAFIILMDAILVFLLKVSIEGCAESLRNVHTKGFSTRVPGTGEHGLL